MMTFHFAYHTTLFAIKGSNNKKNKQNKEKEAK